MPWQNPRRIPSPSRSSDASIPPAPSRRRAGCRRAPISPPGSRASSARAGSAPARAATSGTCSTGSATSRPSRRGSSRAQRAWWLESGRAFADEVRVERRTGIEGWFDAPFATHVEIAHCRRDRRTPQPDRPDPAADPRRAAAVEAGGHDLARVLPDEPARARGCSGSSPASPSGRSSLRVLFATLALTPVMTYLVLPWVTRMLRPWLQRQPADARCRRAAPRSAFDHSGRSYTGAMSTDSLASPTPLPTAPPPPPTLRVESGAVYLALIAGAIGAIYGLIIALLYPDLPLRGEWSFGIFAAIGSSVIAAAVSAIGYWRSRHRPVRSGGARSPPWKFTVNTISVVIVHTALAFLATYVALPRARPRLHRAAGRHVLGRRADGGHARHDGVHRVPVGRRA